MTASATVQAGTLTRLPLCKGENAGHSQHRRSCLMGLHRFNCSRDLTCHLDYRTVRGLHLFDSALTSGFFTPTVTWRGVRFCLA